MKLDFFAFDANVQTYQKAGVTGATGATSPIHAGFAVAPEEKTGATWCYKPENPHDFVAPVAPAKNQGVTLESAPLLVVAPVAPVTPQNADVCIARSESDEKSAVWYLEFPNRDPAEVHFTHDEGRETVAEIYPEAVAIVPVTPTIQQPDAPLSSDDEQKIRAWLADIGADDEETAETLDRCQQDAAAREYFVGRARVDADNI